jgi:isoleucyl-tRNA synthetase
VLYEIEQARQTKRIGKALETKPILFVPQKLLDQVRPDSEELRELLNVSKLALENETASPDPYNIFSDEIHIVMEHADGQKCERCWHWETDVGSNPDYPTICGRCAEAVKQHDG